MSSPMSNLFSPSKLTNIVLRPLSKGIMTDEQSALIPNGALLDAKNYIVGRGGPLRRPGIASYAGGLQVDYPPVKDIITMRKTDGTQITVIIDQKFMYVATTTGLTGEYYVEDTGLISSISGTLVVGSGTSWTGTNEIFAGDVFVVDPSGTPATYLIGSVDSDELLTLTTSPVASTNDFEIRRAFGADDPRYVDHTIVDNEIVFSDSAHKPLAYDGSSLTTWSVDSSITFIPTAVTFHNDRVWVGRTIESGTDWRQRIKWSKVTDHDDFTDGSGNPTFVDLPYSKGLLRRLVPLGRLLVAYFDNAVYIGRPTNIAGSSLPLAFERIETGDRGLVGDRAVYQHVDGHFVVMQDDIYFLGMNLSLQPIGSDVMKETIKSTDNLKNVFVMQDLKNERVLFGFPDLDTYMTKIWSFHLKAKAWSYDGITSTFLREEEIQESFTIDDLNTFAASIDSLGLVFATINAMAGNLASQKIYYGSDGYVRYLSDDQGFDLTNDPINAVIETKDFDLDGADTHKTFVRLSIKIDRTLTSDLEFSVEGSTDRGTNWTTLDSDMTISTGDDEQFCNFLLTGSTARFRISTSSAVEPFRVMEIVIRVRARGLETALGPED